MTLINRINKIEKPDFVIITGDLTEHGWEKETQYFKACMLTFKVPVFLTPGNHDYGATSGWPFGGSLNNYNTYLNPEYQSGNEGDLNDYSFSYSDFHFIVFNSGHATTTVPHLSGLTTAQLDWMKSDYTAAKAAGKTHTFIFTHGPIVGHGGDATHGYWEYMYGPDGWLTRVWVDHDPPFVEWVNGAGMTVEAVFCGHTHQDHVFYDVSTYPTSDNYMDYPPEYEYPTILQIRYYTQSTSYIETNTATKNWG